MTEFETSKRRWHLFERKVGATTYDRSNGVFYPLASLAIADAKSDHVRRVAGGLERLEYAVRAHRTIVSEMIEVDPMAMHFSSKGQARKKPVVISYSRWMGNQAEMHEFMPGVQLALTQFDPKVRVPGLIIPTLEGPMTANYGDYIIKGVQGEFYPCKPDIFEETYEPA